MKFNLNLVTKIQITILVVTVFLLFLFSGFFLYYNLYQPLTSTEEIIVLRNQLTLEKIDTTLFNEVLEILEIKKAAPEIDWATFKNPFLPYSEASMDEIDG